MVPVGALGIHLGFGYGSSGYQLHILELWSYFQALACKNLSTDCPLPPVSKQLYSLPFT